MLSKAVLPDPLYAWEYLSSSLSLTLYVFLYSLHVYSEMFLIISLSLFLWCLDFNLRICFCWSTYTYLDIYRICLHGPLNRCLNMFSRCAPVYTCLTPIAFVAMTWFSGAAGSPGSCVQDPPDEPWLAQDPPGIRVVDGRRHAEDWLAGVSWVCMKL